MGIQEIIQVNHQIKDSMNMNSRLRADPLANGYSKDIYNNFMLVNLVIIHRKDFGVLKIIKFKLIDSFE